MQNYTSTQAGSKELCICFLWTQRWMRRENSNSLRCIIYLKKKNLCCFPLHLPSLRQPDDLGWRRPNIKELNALGGKAVVHFTGLEASNHRGGPGVIAIFTVDRLFTTQRGREKESPLSKTDAAASMGHVWLIPWPTRERQNKNETGLQVKIREGRLSCKSCTHTSMKKSKGQEKVN